ncbi:hypothetical protein HIM_07628 [Hirsutella minnesotensis 3608]|uniref:ATP synthase mitochondrial F1 complex assembly factor 1 n=1 Tax=Hirsutella minnesotensis 3608 TaxID=1043627 RepID=A0A0F7ZHQ6_9HYPO|nr:hypothetical protein HIM_07628 [Hirsutella minnesotensis 3608]
MASIRIPTLRHALAGCRSHACRRSSVQQKQQRRWAKVSDVRFVATTREPLAAVLDKYRNKLEDKARQEGHDDIDGLRSAYADQILQQRLKDAVEFPATNIPQGPKTPVSQPNRGPVPSSETPTPSKPSPPTPPPRDAPPAPRGAGDKPAVKALGDILDLDKARTLPEKELTAIWRLRHAGSPQNICAVIPASTYGAMEEAARAAPQFVLPVPHESQGAEMHFLQWTFDAPSRTSTVLFTQLAEYKARGEFAQPHTTITHHLDLAAEKGLVLMQGQLVDGRGVKPEHAEWLVVSLQRFYGAWDGADPAGLQGERRERAEQRRNLLQWFAAGDSRFSVEKLLEEAERMG